MLSTVAYTICIVFLICHELDAVQRREWRLLFFLRNYPDAVAGSLFVAIHLPLFLVLLWFDANDPQSKTAIAISAFAIVHLVLHLRLRNHPKNEFNNMFSWLLIIVASVAGATHLATNLV